MRNHLIGLICIAVTCGLFTVLQGQTRLTKPNSVKFVPKIADTRAMAFYTSGQTYTVKSDSWSKYGTCWYWGLKDTLTKVINASNSTPPNMPCSNLSSVIINSSLSKPDSGLLVYTGYTTYKYVATYSYGNYVSSGVQVRLWVQITDTFGKKQPFTDIDSAYIVRANKDFRIQVYLEALGPSDALNCNLYGSCNTWLPAIKLFDYLHTDPYSSICTSFDLGTFWQVSTSVTATNTGAYCFGDTIRIKGSGGKKASWLLNNKEISTNYNYSMKGTVGNTTFQFTGEGDLGCEDTAYTIAVVHAKPTADFAINDSTQCFNTNNFDFTNLSSLDTGKITSNWKIGSHNKPIDSNSIAGFAFNSTGRFSVTLSVKSKFGCTDSMTKSIIVYPNPSVNPRVDSTCENNTTTCKGNNNIFGDSIISSVWNFSDGSSLNQENGSMLFSTTGLIKAIYTASSLHGCAASDSLFFKVFSIPKVDFNFLPNSNICSGDPILFTASASNKFGDLEGYHWDFGDNSGSTLDELTKIYRVYNTTSFNVTLTVYGSGNCKDSLVKRVDIQEKPRTCKFKAVPDYGIGYWGIKMQPMDSLNFVGGQANVSYEFIVEGIDTITSAGVSAEALFKLNVDGIYNLKIKAKSTIGANCNCESVLEPFKLDRLGTQDIQSIYRLYPNPIDGGSELQIAWGGQTSIKQITLSNSTGKQIANWEGRSILSNQTGIRSIILPPISTGLHFIDIYTEQGSSRLPVIIK